MQDVRVSCAQDTRLLWREVLFVGVHEKKRVTLEELEAEIRQSIANLVALFQNAKSNAELIEQATVAQIYLFEFVKRWRSEGMTVEKCQHLSRKATFKRLRRTAGLELEALLDGAEVPVGRDSEEPGTEGASEGVQETVQQPPKPDTEGVPSDPGRSEPDVVDSPGPSESEGPQHEADGAVGETPEGTGSGAPVDETPKPEPTEETSETGA
jgi:hypothetical protein